MTARVTTRRRGGELPTYRGEQRHANVAQLVATLVRVDCEGHAVQQLLRDAATGLDDLQGEGSAIAQAAHVDILAAAAVHGAGNARGLLVEEGGDDLLHRLPALAVLLVAAVPVLALCRSRGLTLAQALEDGQGHGR
jgi:hypothetical protein